MLMNIINWLMSLTANEKECDFMISAVISENLYEISGVSDPVVSLIPMRAIALIYNVLVSMGGTKSSTVD